MTRNPKAIENPKLPYFQISIPPKEEGGKWTEVGAAWKAKSGKEGVYSIRLNENIQIVVGPDVANDPLMTDGGWDGTEARKPVD